MHSLAISSVQESPSTFELIGAIAAALAIAVTLAGAWTWLYRYLRRRQLLAHLRAQMLSIQRIDAALRDTTWKMEKQFSEGFPWTGYAVFQGPLLDNLQTLQRLTREAGDIVSRTRALEASGADERLRVDIERLSEGLRQVVPLYIWGIVASYRRGYPMRGKGDPGAPTKLEAKISPSATGREPTRTLRSDDRARVRDLRLDLRVLFQSVVVRLDMDDLEDVPFAAWPIDMAEAYQEEANLRVDLTVPYET